MRLLTGGVGIIATLVFAFATMAQDITLTARDGGLALSGQLVSYDGEFYRVDTVYGGLTVASEGVICDGPACPELTAPLTVIRVVGAAEAGARLLPRLFAGFAAARGLTYIAGETGSDTSEITDPLTAQPLARISFVAMPPDASRAEVLGRKASLALLFQSTKSAHDRAVGLEPLIPIVAQNNLFPAIRSSDLSAALTGKITNWQELGGPDMPIVVHALTPDADFAAAISARVGQLASGPRHADAESLAAAVAHDPWALALIGQSDKGAARALPLTDACDFPMLATDLNVKAEDYPLTVPLFLAYGRYRQPLLLREFLEYLATDAAQADVAAAGFVDRRLGRAPLTEDGQRLLGAIRNAGTEVPLAELQRLATAMTGGQRLSLTFRFQDGSAQLDAHSRENLADLARQIAAGNFRGESLALAGFSDGTGTAAVNLDLSRTRAEAVRSALRVIAPDLRDDQLPRIEAFGEALPMACDTTATGRQINRRVELWVHPIGNAIP
ncbi:OmpA family protein [Pseudorhodobacter sp.]|uniref:OmpA family protein n=1 Tax=Pseudorhodobacter sp. TaxID=1934400 RepID=UPI002647122A|nr:phosphate ABC transporter substrate-binding/OmpA family protein [Pseudorhodobacter sp.]MDN5785798.1 phosphate ABC transporter substrate-binding/OmpA family protein [Pseudorhodobacter sp.]